MDDVYLFLLGRLIEAGHKANRLYLVPRLPTTELPLVLEEQVVMGAVSC
jgi:hypothetical protein